MLEPGDRIVGMRSKLLIPGEKAECENFQLVIARLVDAKNKENSIPPEELGQFMQAFKVHQEILDTVINDEEL